MIRRETWILIVILAALVGLAWYLNSPASPTKASNTPTATIETPQYLFTNDAKLISSISVTDKDGNTFLIERGPGSVWLIKKPIEAIADQTKGEDAAMQVASLRILTTLESAPDPSATGLDKPAYEFSVLTTDGKTSTVKIGSLTVTGSGYYAQGETGNVVVLNKLSVENITGLLNNPPYAETPTPSPVVTETPTPTLEFTPTSKP
jgi:uncharacterized protein DUF4340